MSKQSVLPEVETRQQTRKTNLAGLCVGAKEVFFPGREHLRVLGARSQHEVEERTWRKNALCLLHQEAWWPRDDGYRGNTKNPDEYRVNDMVAAIAQNLSADRLQWKFAHKRPVLRDDSTRPPNWSRLGAPST